MELECYPTTERPPEIVPGRPQRAWMDAFAEPPPLSLPAADHGQHLRAGRSSARSPSPPSGTAASTRRTSRSRPTGRTRTSTDFVKSHFSHGVLTFHPGYLFRTPPGWSMWAMGPPNHVKDGIQPLAGLVETDWLPFPFTMNWLFTRPGKVRFEKGEPFCFITLIQDKPLHEIQPVIRRMDSNPELRDQYDVWDEAPQRVQPADLPPATRRRPRRPGSATTSRASTRRRSPPAREDHVNKRRLKAPRFGR